MNNMNSVRLIPSTGFDYVSKGYPDYDTNPDKVGATWLNVSIGEIFVCTDNTTDANIWRGQRFTNVVNSPAITTSGLVLHLSARNSRSYYENSKTWTDLVTGKDFGVANAPFAGKLGFFFNGVNGVAQANTVHTVGTNSFSIDFWVRPLGATASYSEANSGTGALSGTKLYVNDATNMGTDAGFGVACGTNGISFIEHGNSHMPCLLWYAATIPSTSFSHYTAVCTNKVYTLYKDGVLVDTGLTSSKTNVYLQSYRFGAGTASGADSYFYGYMGEILFYNKALSAAEILVNHNALNGLWS